MTGPVGPDGPAPQDRAPQIVVRGQSVLGVDPEIAVLSVVAAASARDRETALERCAARQDEVEAVVASAGDAVEAAETTGIGVSVRRRSRGGPDEAVASVRTRVTLARLDAVGDLAIALGRIEGVELSGPSWQLRRDSPAHERARLAAVQDAVHRARQYAAAFGAELTALVQVADEGLSATADGGMERMAFAVAESAGGPAVLDLTPVRQEVRGAVEVRFTMSAPDPATFRGQP